MTTFKETYDQPTLIQMLLLSFVCLLLMIESLTDEQRDIDSL